MNIRLDFETLTKAAMLAIVIWVVYLAYLGWTDNNVIMEEEKIQEKALCNSVDGQYSNYKRTCFLSRQEHKFVITDDGLAMRIKPEQGSPDLFYFILGIAIGLMIPWAIRSDNSSEKKDEKEGDNDKKND